MKYMILLLILILSLCVASFAYYYRKSEQQINLTELGMTKDDVIKKLGGDCSFCSWSGSYGEGDVIYYRGLFVTVQITLKNNQVVEVGRRYGWSNTTRVYKYNMDPPKKMVELPIR